MDTIPNLDRDHLAQCVRAWNESRQPQRDRLVSHLRMAGHSDEAERLQRGDDPESIANGMVRS